MTDKKFAAAKPTPAIIPPRFITGSVLEDNIRYISLPDIRPD